VDIKSQLERKICEYDFALDELYLFLDSHPDNEKAMSLVKRFRLARKTAIEEYEKKYGKYFVTTNETPDTSPWQWTLGPWPWEIADEKGE